MTTKIESLEGSVARRRPRQISKGDLAFLWSSVAIGGLVLAALVLTALASLAQ